MGSVGSDAQAGCSTVSIAEGTRNVLLLGSAFDHETGEACADLLVRAPPERTDLLAVTLQGSPDDCLDTWRSRSPAGLPAKVGMVGAGDQMRSAAAAGQGGTMNMMGGRVAVSSVPEAGDLTGLGIRTSQFLSEWHGDGNQTVVCFDSLSTLLQTTDLQRAFRFVHLLSKRVAAVDGVAHFHMDPDAHSGKAVATIRSLFDTVLTFEDDHWQSP